MPPRAAKKKTHKQASQPFSSSLGLSVRLAPGHLATFYQASSPSSSSSSVSSSPEDRTRLDLGPSSVRPPFALFSESREEEEEEGKYCAASFQLFPLLSPFFPSLLYLDLHMGEKRAGGERGEKRRKEEETAGVDVEGRKDDKNTELMRLLLPLFLDGGDPSLN